MTAPERAPESGAPARTRGGMSLTRRYQGVPLWLWVVGGTAIVTGVIVFVRNRRKGAADSGDTAGGTDTAGGGSTSPAYGNPISLVPVDTNGPDVSSDQVTSLLTAINNLNGTLSKPVTQPGGPTGNTTSVDAVIPGKLNFKWTQRDLARALLPKDQQSDANAVERELGLLHKYNPTWITSGPNATRPLGGHHFRKPVTT